MTGIEYIFVLLGFVTQTAVAMMILLSFTYGAPVDKYSTHCKISKTARGLIKHLLPMSLTLGGEVYRSYTNIVSLIFIFIHSSTHSFVPPFSQSVS